MEDIRYTELSIYRKKTSMTVKKKDKILRPKQVIYWLIFVIRRRRRRIYYDDL